MICPRKVRLLLLAFLAMTSFRFGNGGSPIDQIIKLYNKADSLFHLQNPTSTTDSTALVSFGQVINMFEKYPGFTQADTILFQAYLKRGILFDTKADYNAAKQSYLKALSLRAGNDSLAFIVYVYAGASYYNLNDFDSANHLLLKAESLINPSSAPEDKARLYNSLGALYYDNGNYLQSKNYFNQALQIIKDSRPDDINSIAGIEINIATSFYRLGLYEEALSIYTTILKYHVLDNYIYMNMGRANTALNKYPEALSCFRKVDAGEVPGVFNEMAYTQMKLSKFDSAAYFLNQLQFYRNSNKLNALDMGINESYRSELLVNQQKIQSALSSLQKAIIIFSGNFDDENIYSNPSNFTGSFAYYRLFDALSAKAEAFELLYEQNKKESCLQASLSTYNSTLSLLNYIEKSYETDDAKIFLKKKSRYVYQKALAVCLELYRLYPDDKFLEQAFLISEKNKASIVIASLQEKASSDIPGFEEKLLQQERNIKYNIARLNIKSDQASDSKMAESIANEKGRYEIELSHLQKDLERNNSYYKIKYDDTYPNTEELQQHLNNNQALISFYTTADALHVFILTQSSFRHVRIDSLRELQHDTEAWLQLLKTTENGRKFNGQGIAKRLYEHLIKPIQSVAAEKDDWIIIPDGILYFLPFESLPADEASKTLLETTTISYQFSSRFIIHENTADQNSSASYDVLAFAPFVKEGTGFDQPGFGHMDQLPGSGEEIKSLPGKQYIDSLATKENFLREINKFPIVHLATHAVSDINNASASFIAFYPQKKSATEDCLFLEELYGLNMDHTKLVIISACETGKGELVNNEGVISLARAFIYAGCSSAINSLWKADDRATSAILKQFHAYLQKGYTKSKALQQAKLDYINGNSLYRSPNYWAHLILIGDADAVYTKKQVPKWAIIFGLIGLGSLFFIVRKWKQKIKKKSTFSADRGFYKTLSG